MSSTRNLVSRGAPEHPVIGDGRGSSTWCRDNESEQPVSEVIVRGSSLRTSSCLKSQRLNR